MSERPLTYDHLRSRKKPVTKTVRLALDSELADEFEEAKEELDKLNTRLEYMAADDTRLPVLRAQRDKAQAKHDELRAALLEESVVFKLRSIGRKRFDELIEAHPPTEAQIAKAKEDGDGELNWNGDTFPQALLAQCMVEPKMEEHEVKDMWDSEDWSGAEMMQLFLSALDANNNRRKLELGKD